MFLQVSVCPWGWCIPACLAGYMTSQVGGLGGCPGPGLGSVQAQARGGVQAQAQGVCIPAGTEADTPQQMTTAAGGTHPTGMHSCLHLRLVELKAHSYVATTSNFRDARNGFYSNDRICLQGRLHESALLRHRT